MSSSPLSTFNFNVDLTPLSPQTCWNWTPRSGSQCGRQCGLYCVTVEMDGIPQKCSSFSMWNFTSTILPLSFRLLKVGVGLWKVVKQRAKCEMSALTVMFRASHEGFIGLQRGCLLWVVLWRREFEYCRLLLMTCLPVSCLKTPWLFMKSIFNKAEYSLAWKFLKIIIIMD